MSNTLSHDEVRLRCIPPISDKTGELASIRPQLRAHGNYEKAASRAFGARRFLGPPKTTIESGMIYEATELEKRSPFFSLVVVVSWSRGHKSALISLFMHGEHRMEVAEGGSYASFG
ncbi:hypothetical protein MRX96_004877 [Rhipicephalus microplus]